MKIDPPSAEVLAELREEHGELVELQVDGIHVVLAKPSKVSVAGVYNRFVELSADPKSRAKALAGLFRSCAVYPSKEQIGEMLAELPGLGMSFGAHALELIGLREVDVKKG